MTKSLEATGAIQALDEMLEELDDGVYMVSVGAEQTIRALRARWYELVELCQRGEQPDWDVL